MNQDVSLQLNALFEKISTGVSESLVRVGYPNRPLYMEIPNVLTIEVRVPPSLPPDDVRELGIKKTLHAFPAIEVIRITPKLQRYGLFTRIVHTLAKIPDVRAVVVSNVENQDFAKKLASLCEQPDSNWRPYEGGFFPSFAYWVDPSRYRS